MCRQTEAALPTCDGGHGQPRQPELWVGVALQVVPGRMRGQSRQTALRWVGLWLNCFGLKRLPALSWVWHRLWGL